jgi:16S rRNA (adenine(1408)-N(1))-methyltransferase
LAARDPLLGAVAVDLCAANMAAAARAAPANALFVVADALALPAELTGLADRVTINFPWGSLQRGLLDGCPGLLDGLVRLGRGAATLELRLNAGALAEHGWTLEAGTARIAAVLRAHGFTVAPPRDLGPAELRRWPTTWAKRLAFGRDPRAVHLEARLPRRDQALGRPPPAGRAAAAPREGCGIFTTIARARGPPDVRGTDRGTVRPCRPSATGSC